MTLQSMFDRELKKGGTELLVLSLLEDGPRHGYEISKEVVRRSRGGIELQLPVLYPLLYRLETRGWIQGRWVERAGHRRRRYYRLTPAGRRTLAAQRHTWREFVAAMNRITGLGHA
jgi:PadR family transcriptional regulator PadR